MVIRKPPVTKKAMIDWLQDNLDYAGVPYEGMGLDEVPIVEKILELVKREGSKKGECPVR
jgi:hypothetical protein